MEHCRITFYASVPTTTGIAIRFMGILAAHAVTDCGSPAKRSHAEMSECPIGYPERYCPTNDQRHNAKGHSYLSRFLICACTSKLYKRNEAALPAILKETALELEQLFQHGIVTSSGVRIRFALVGCKGDAEWHFEAGIYTRSYHNSSTKKDLMICPWCSAGAPGLPFTDASDEPC